MALEARLRRKLEHFTLDVSLACGGGRLLAIVGPSGAGKTTILRIIAGLERADEGHVTCSGETWADTGCRFSLPTRKRGVGYVFQEFTLFPHLSVYKNVAFAARDERTVEELLRRFGIWHLRDSRPHLISGGERQRCALCQALARQPRALLMDEPFSALDPLTRRRLRETVRGMKAELDIPIIHVTHDLREALILADEILPVVRGRVCHKWLLSFLMTAREGFRCRQGDDTRDDIELPLRTGEYPG